MACSSTEVSKMTFIAKAVGRTCNLSVTEVGLNPAHATKYKAYSSTETSKMVVIIKVVIRICNLSVTDVGLNPAHATNRRDSSEKEHRY
jgi:hypothetical protein